MERKHPGRIWREDELLLVRRCHEHSGAFYPLSSLSMNRFFGRYFFPVLLGSFLYALCRPTTLLYERIVYVFVGASWPSLKRGLNYSCRSVLADDFAYRVIVYSLPNALWHVSLCFVLSFGVKSFWGVKGAVWRFRLVLFLFVAFVPDFLQFLGFLPGTFDIFDIALAFLASVFVWAVT